MKVGNAIETFIDLYKRARDNPQIIDPVAWALYKTWRIADTDRKNKVKKAEKKY